MRRVMRDAWSWRGGFAPDEIEHEPRLGDARRGPIEEPAHTEWPVLDTQLEAAWPTRQPGEDMHALLGPAIAHLVLCARTGGYHAVLPAELRSLEREYERLRRGDGSVLSFLESVGRLEAAGVVERTATSIGLLAPPRMRIECMQESRDRADAHEHRAPDDAVTVRFLRRVRRQTYTELGLTRYRELARFGRLRATVAEAPAKDAHHSVFETSGQSMPTAASGSMTADALLYPGRSLIGLREIELASGGRGVPILATGAEVGALVLGAGRGANAVRRAVRAATVWLVCADEAQGRATGVELPIARLARAAAVRLGLNPEVDHRSRIRDLVCELERVGALERGDGDGRVHVLHPPAVKTTAVRRFFDQWVALQGSVTGESAGTLDLAERHLGRYVHPAWRSLLEERRLSIRIVPRHEARALLHD